MESAPARRKTRILLDHASGSSTGAGQKSLSPKCGLSPSRMPARVKQVENTPRRRDKPNHPGACRCQGWTRPTTTTRREKRRPRRKYILQPLEAIELFHRPTE